MDKNYSVDKVSEKPLPHSKSTREESEKINKRILELISSNKDWREIYRIIKKELSDIGKEYSYVAIQKRYRLVLAEVMTDINEDIQETRAKRIKSLKRDLEEAYTNYENEENPKIKHSWYETYLSIKNNIDKFFPNALQPKEESNELSLKIEYIDTNS